jgi:dipeptidyl aminopeptidase/acylaminoacyl peptidase
MAAWAGESKRFGFVTNRSGEPDIWAHESDGSERPVVTGALFPADTTKRLINPALSPAGDRLAYTRIRTDGPAAIWISSLILVGGPPVRLTDTDAGDDYEFMASWSPDGGRVAYLRNKSHLGSLMICRTTGQATPLELRSKTEFFLPDWSPMGEWISYRDESGWNLISPDGRSTRALGKIATPHLTFFKGRQDPLRNPRGGSAPIPLLARPRDPLDEDHRKCGRRLCARQLSGPGHSFQPFARWQEYPLSHLQGETQPLDAGRLRPTVLTNETQAATDGKNVPFPC